VTVCYIPADPRAVPVVTVAPAGQFAGLPVHQAGSGPGLLPGVVVLHQAGDGLVRQLERKKTCQNSTFTAREVFLQVVDVLVLQ